MSTAATQQAYNRKFFDWVRDAWYLSKPYWRGEDRFKGYLLITLVVILNLAMVMMTVILNKWYNVFYDALQQYDVSQFIRSMIEFGIIAFLFILFNVLGYYFRKMLEIRWRRWLTHHYIERWMHSKAYYKSKFAKQISDNPDQRISQDIDEFIVLTLNLTLGFLNSVVTLISFVTILWGLSKVLHFSVMGYDLTVHGYLVWAALIYAIVGTYIVFKIGKPLIGLNYQQQRYEANFRFNLMRVREYNENIAFYRGEKNETKHLGNRFTSVVDNFIRIVHRQLRIDIFSTGYNQIAIIFPFIVAAPAYFAKEIMLGGVMQINSAFSRVQGAMSFFISAYSTMASWRATMDRLYGFQVVIDESQEMQSLNHQSHDRHCFDLHHLNVYLPNGKTLINDLSLSIDRGDRLLIKGRSGSGKTTLLRTIAGIWPFCEGEIYKQENMSLLFIAQKPYLPMYEFKEAVCYPLSQMPNDEDFVRILEQCEIGHLAGCIGTVEDWSHALSVGEQQRLAFCRIMINQADVVFLDESTSALDEETEAKLYQLITQSCPQSIIISVGHRSTIKCWHNKVLDLLDCLYVSIL